MHFTLTRIKNTAMRILAILVLSSFSSIGFSQDNVGDESTVVYPAAYFAEFAPVTAQDMLDRIPGVGTPTGGPSFGGGGRPRGVIFGRGPAGGGRGFGGGQSGGNEILINGKRTAGKTNNTSGQLDRIAADQVEYIELIRGTSGDLDVRGSGQVINVVLFEEISSTSISYEVSMERYLDHATEPGGSLSVSGQAGELNYVINATVTAGYDHSVSKENSVLGDFSPNDIIREDRITIRLPMS